MFGFVNEDSYDVCGRLTGQTKTLEDVIISGREHLVNECALPFWPSELPVVASSPFFASVGIKQWSKVRGDALLASTAATHRLSPPTQKYLVLQETFIASCSYADGGRVCKDFRALEDLRDDADFDHHQLR